MEIKALNDARKLARKYQEVEGLRRYVQERPLLLIFSGAVLLMLGLGCAAGTFMFIADLSPALTIPALLVAALVLAGSLLVLAYTFFSWLENRALMLAIGRRGDPVRWATPDWVAKRAHVRVRVQFRVQMGKAPQVPWGAAAIFVAVPVAMLAWTAPGSAFLLIVLGILMPIVYAFIDR